MIGITKKTDYPDTGVCVHASTKCLSRQNRRLLDFRSMADTACYCPDYYCRHYHLPYLETQA